ncbi:hypothetical protein BH23BAC4_BH23BAC4_11020 [soil metagenome]
MYKDFLIDGREQELTDLEQKVVEATKSVYDPEIPVPVWDLGLIYGIDVTPVDNPAEGEEGLHDVYVRMTLTAPNCPAAGTLPGEVEQKVNAIDEVRRAKVEIVFVPSFSMEMMSEDARLTLGFL